MNVKPISAALILFFLAAIFTPTAAYCAKTQDAASSVTVQAEKGYLADEIAGLEKPAQIKGPGIIGTTINLILALLFVIGLSYLLMAGLKYFYFKASIPLKSEGIIKILAKEHLDKNKTVYVLEFADRVLVLASGGDNNIVPVTEIKDAETVEKIKLSADEYISKYRKQGENKFADEMKATYARQGKKIIDSGNTAVKNFIDRLKGGKK